MPKYVEELVSQQVHRSELARQREIEKGKVTKDSVVTISRRMGSGARIVAAKLAESLGWSLWDKELLNAITEHAHVSSRIVEAFDERTVSEIEVFARHIFGDSEMGGFIYARHLAKAVKAIAELGNAIILGRGANFILPEALNIRIDASDEHRIRNMMSYENLTRDEARTKIYQSDRERDHFLTSVFGRERVENAHYDLTIWMDEFSTDNAVDIIKVAIKARCKG